MGAEKVGEGIGYAAGATYQKAKEHYQKKRGGGEYREARIKEYESRAKEQQARNKLYTAQAKQSKLKQGAKGSQPDLSFIHGGSKPYGERLDFLSGSGKGKKKGGSNSYNFLLGK